MKKSIKVLMIIVGVLISLVIMDTLQAIIFDNKPMLKLVDNIDGGNLYQKNKGILVDNYVCSNGNKKTVFKFHKYDCPKKKQEYAKPGEESKIEIRDNGVKLKIKDKILIDSNAVLVLENNTDYEVGYGQDYFVEKEIDGKWYALNIINERVFNMPLYILKPNEDKEKHLNLSYGYGELTPGKYRVVKGVSFEYENNNREEFYIAGEFIISDVKNIEIKSMFIDKENKTISLNENDIERVLNILDNLEYRIETCDGVASYFIQFDNYKYGLEVFKDEFHIRFGNKEAVLSKEDKEYFEFLLEYKS